MIKVVKTHAIIAPPNCIIIAAAHLATITRTRSICGLAIKTLKMLDWIVDLICIRRSHTIWEANMMCFIVSSCEWEERASSIAPLSSWLLRLIFWVQGTSLVYDLFNGTTGAKFLPGGMLNFPFKVFNSISLNRRL